MSTPKRQITKADIIPLEAYTAERQARRRSNMEIKKPRRIEVGPVATFYFENFDTMFQQIHEMLFIEKGGDEQIDDELRAYNPLIPQGGELVATLMFEIDDPTRRTNMLRRLTHVEETIFFDVGGERVKGEPEQDIDRTAADGKTSAVHFIHFRFTPAQVAKFSDREANILLGFAHENYGHMALLSEPQKQALAADLK